MFGICTTIIFPLAKGRNFFAFETISNYLRTWDVASASRVDWFWSNSEFVARRIRKFYRRDAKVIFPPCLPEKWKVVSETKDDFYLIVSAFAPYKRIDLAIETFRKNGKRLVIIGGGQEFKKLTSKLPKNVEILPHLKREEVLEYYKKAKAFLFPGMEDFGIAPVEAQAYCTPVIAFGKGGALETVVSGKTGIFFEEQTVDSLQVAIDRSDRISWKTSEFQRNVNRFTEEKFIIEIRKQVENRIGTPRKKG